MYTNRNEYEPDELLIPSRDGFIRIPTNSIRVKEEPRRTVQKNREQMRSYQVGNVLQFVTMITGMVALMAFIGYSVAGFIGLAVVSTMGAFGFWVASNTRIDRMLRSRHISGIDARRGYRLYRMAEELAEKAGLDKMPRLFLDSRPMVNAYTVEDKERSAIVLSEALLASLSPREIKGVLAHEVAHLKNRDIGIMLFSDQIRRLTGFMAIAGQLLLVVYLPLMLVNGISVPWALLLTMIAAPTASTLLQVALSRNREFKADMDAVELSGDAVGLASALKKINAHGNFWQKLYAPYVREIPELLRTHPNTSARIERLRNVQKERDFDLAWEA